MDERIARKLWGDPNVSDVTNDRDVSDVVEEYDTSSEIMEPMDIPVVDDVPESSVVFSSLDGRKYLIDKTTINWDETAANESNLVANKSMILNMLMSVISERASSVDTESAEYATSVIRNFINEFGLIPKYNEVYPDASVHDIAICYCVDAISIINIILIEIARYNGNKSVMDCLINSISNKEETTNEDHVQEA